MANKIYYTHKRNFTGGEVDTLLNEKVDFTRYVNGCHELLNMVVKSQGATSRRSGTKFVYDLTSLSPDRDYKPTMIPFVFNESQAYVLVFFVHTTGTTRVAFLTNTGLVEDPASPGNPYIFEFTGVMDATEFDYTQSNDILYIVQGERRPVELKRSAHDSWAATETTFTDMPTGLSGWQTSQWPRKVSFFEQRMAFGSTATRPQTVWFSQSGDFANMGVSGTPVASDAVTLTMNSGVQNKLMWMVPARSLLIGTLGDEWNLSGRGSEPLSFESFSMIKHTNQGSQNIKPIQIGPITIFVEQLGRVVNQFMFNYATDSYDVVDLTVLAPHLTDSAKIVSWTYQKTPNGVVWAVRDDGTIIAVTLKREHNVVGWHRHTTDGSFLDVCAIPGDDETDLFTCVEREIDGSTVWYLEVKSPEFLSTSPIDSRFLDSHLVYEGVDTATIDGLDHLIGEAVTVLVNGKVYPTTPVVDADGEIAITEGTLDAADNVVVVGLPFKSRVVPTPGVVPLKDGASSSRKHKVIHTNVSLHRSSGMRIGVQTMFGKESVRYIPFRREYDVTTDAVPLFTGYKGVDLTETSADPEASRINRVVIEQESPLPLTVLGLIDYMYTSE